ncbi:MAG: hypothetical protein CMP34_00010 [Rickettsiales bacterium]|nr:hypothetical protein [Rickettsiales bacterium]
MNGIIISGQPRSGKSTLVKSLKNKKNILACNVDAKLIKMIREQDINFQDESLKKIIKNLIGRCVFQDSQKKIKTSILNEINVPLEEIVRNLKKHPENNRPEFFFFKILESSREYLKKKFWLLPDLGAEDYFEYIKKKSTKIKIIFLFRNPLESITASLYWRTYPQKKKNIFELIVRWNYSVSRAKYLTKTYSDRVELLYYNEINKKLHIKNLGEVNFNYDIKKTYFSFNGNEWLCPDNKYRKLLNENEKLHIMSCCSYNFENQKKSNLNLSLFIKRKYSRLLNFLFLNLSFISPLLSRRLMDFYFSPAKLILEKIKEVFKLIKKNINKFLLS